MPGRFSLGRFSILLPLFDVISLSKQTQPYAWTLHFIPSFWDPLYSHKKLYIDNLGLSFLFSAIHLRWRRQLAMFVVVLSLLKMTILSLRNTSYWHKHKELTSGKQFIVISKVLSRLLFLLLKKNYVYFRTSTQEEESLIAYDRKHIQQKPLPNIYTQRPGKLRDIPTNSDTTETRVQD